MINNVDEIISKSLDQVETILSQIKAEAEDDTINKGMNNNEPEPDDVSENAPESEEGTENPEEGEEGTENPEEGNEEGTDIDEEEGNEEEDTEKSLESALSEDEGVRKALEVSEFLTQLVKSISTVIGDQRVDINKSLEATTHQGEILAKSFEGLAKSQKAVLETQVELLKSVRKLNTRIDGLEKQPLTRKSMPNTKAVEKSFKASVGATGNTNVGTSANSEGTTLSKSEAVTILTNEFSKGNSSITSDILALESTGDFNVLSQSAKAILKL